MITVNDINADVGVFKTPHLLVMDGNSLSQLRDKLTDLCLKMRVCENAINNINSAKRYLPNKEQWFDEKARDRTLVFLQAAKISMQNLDTGDIIESIASTETAFQEAEVYVHKERAEPVHATEETGWRADRKLRKIIRYS